MTQSFDIGFRVLPAAAYRSHFAIFSFATWTILSAIVANAQEARLETFQPQTDVQAAADKITEATIRGPIRFLADDLLEGRGPGTTSDALVQLYLSTQLESAGLLPAGPEGKWIQPVPMLGLSTKNPPTFEFRGKSSTLTLKYYDEMITTCGVPKETASIDDAEVVFVGYGIQAPEYQWDDFKGMDLRGKVLLMLNNDPEGSPETDPNLFAGRKRLYYGRWDYKYASAARQGAAGAIIIHTSPSAGYPWSVIQTSWSGEEFELDGLDAPRLQAKAWVTEDAASRIVSQAGYELKQLVDSAQRRDFKPVALETRLSLSLSAAVRKKSTGNVIGVIPGSDSELKKEYVMLMAHHDHLGLAETRDAEGDAIYNGAIDNASGVASLLAITKAIQSLPSPLKRSVLVAAVGAEEQGLLGSAYFAAHPTVDPKQVSALINMDGINHLGRSADVHLIGAGKSSLDTIVDRVAKFQGRMVTPDLFPDKGYYYRSDQFSLAKIGIPGVYLHAGTSIIGKPNGWGKEQLEKWTQTKYHQTSDEYDLNWNLEGGVEDTRLLFYVATEIANADRMQTWNAGDEFASIRK